MDIMGPIKVKLCLSLLLTMVLIPAFSKTLVAQEEVALSLDQTVRMALEHDYQVNSARNDLEKAKLVVKEKVIGALPQLQIGAEQGENLTTGSDLQNASLAVTETIPTSFQLYGKKTASDLEVAKWGQQASEADYRISRANLVYNTITLYLNALKAKGMLDYHEAVVNNFEAKAKNAKIQLSLGKVTKVTQLTAENDLAKARYELENSRQAYLLNLKQIAQTIGVKDYRSLRLEQNIPQTLIEEVDLEQMLAKALDKRLEISKSQVAVKEAEQELAKAFNEGLPTLSLAYQNRSQEESYNLEYDFLKGDLSWTAAWQQDYLDDITYSGNDDVFGNYKSQYKLRLSWALSMGGAKNRIKQAGYTLENAKLAQSQTARGIIAEVEEAASAYELAGLKRIQVERGLALYQKDLELTQLKFQLGTATALEVTDAELKMADAQLEIDNAQCDLRLAAEKVRLAMGELYDYPIF
ncbi:MAG: TolC family protein [Firmicutes bacterium]|nr:TolC family protein [Bacillota bacterium]